MTMSCHAPTHAVKALGRVPPTLSRWVRWNSKYRSSSSRGGLHSLKTIDANLRLVL